VSDALLLEIVGREARSLIKYAAGAAPWVPGQAEAAWLTVRRLIAEETESYQGLTGLLERRHLALPLPGAFPARFARLHYVALPFLVARLADYERQAIGELEADQGRFEEPEGASAVGTLVALRRRHLAILEGLLEAPPLS
jgi:hypothetical protein